MPTVWHMVTQLHSERNTLRARISHDTQACISLRKEMAGHQSYSINPTITWSNSSILADSCLISPVSVAALVIPQRVCRPFILINRCLKNREERRVPSVSDNVLSQSYTDSETRSTHTCEEHLQDSRQYRENRSLQIQELPYFMSIKNISRALIACTIFKNFNKGVLFEYCRVSDKYHIII